MALIPSGMGWSADENYMAQYSGVVLATISGLSGGIRIPYVAADADVPIQGLYVGTDAEGRSVYLRADDDTYDYILLGCSQTGGNRGLWIISTTNGSVTKFQYNADRSLRLKTALTGFSKISGTDLWRHTAGYSNWETFFTDVNPYIPVYTTYTDAVAACVVTYDAITKANDGYCTVAYVKYKWQGGYGDIDVTPVMISSAPGNTEFSGVPNGVSIRNINYYYNGVIFRMSFLYNLEGSSRGTILEIDLTSQGELDDDELFLKLAVAESLTVTETVDPYHDFPPTEPGGGMPNPNPQDDDISVDPLPTLSFADTGFCRIYRPSLSQLNDLADYMWTDDTFLQTVLNHAKQLFENPMDSIISLSLVPCVPPVSADVNVKVMFIPTGVYMPPVTNQFVSVDCGSLFLEEMYGSALDYNPYTRVQLYLPYIGTVQLDTDEVMNKTIHVEYRIDVVTGLCCASVSAGPDVLYQFSGHCAITQPINSADFSGYIGAAMAAGKLVGAIVATGAGAPAVAATLVGAATPSSSSESKEIRATTRNPATGRQITSGTVQKETTRKSSGASFGEVAARGISNTVGAVMNSKTIIQHSGGFSGNSGYIAGVRRPYLIVTRPRIANPENYGQYNGRPSMLYLNLGSCTGFTQVQSIQLTGIAATNPELSEIATLLMSGVIF